MALPRLNTEHSDVSAWAIAALICGAIAVLSANIGGLVPANILTGLHTTRLDGGNVNQLRSQMIELRAENARISRDYRTLLARLNLLDDDSGETIRRLAAVERSLPLLIESLPIGTDIDRSLLTASIAAASPEVYAAEGGIIVIRHSSLFENAEDAGSLDQPLPPTLDAPRYGVALGGDTLREYAAGRRTEIMAQTGPLLAGLTFLKGDAEETAYTRIIAGPFASFEEASVLCEPLEAMTIDCRPVPFEGESWPL